MDTGDRPAARTRGFLFVCWGDTFVREAAASARRLRSYSRDQCALVTDDQAKVELSSFDRIIMHPFSKTYRDKILMRLSPFDDTIFLDSDTHAIGEFEEIFAALERFDVLYQPTGGGYHYSIEGLPMAVLTEPSAGIVAWRRNQRTARFFELWEEHYSAEESANGSRGAWDQRSMRAALWFSEVYLLPLPNEWQVCPWETKTLDGEVKMLHGRGFSVEPLSKHINASRERRVYIGHLKCVLPMYGSTLSDYLKLVLASVAFVAKRAVRLALHHTGAWRIPENKRPM